MVRAYTGYATQRAATPQSQPIPGRESDMVANNAGGFGFVLDDWERLNRFLILGSCDGTYYVGESQLTAQNAEVVIRCIKMDGPRVVRAAYDINISNRAPKTDQQLFALALAVKHGDAETKAAVEAALPSMLRTGTHVLHFAAILDSLCGWSRAKRRMIANWFTGRDADALAYQVLKYRQRDGWAMRDLLRVAHPAAPDAGHAAIYDWICGRPSQTTVLPNILAAYQRMMATEEHSPSQKAMWGIKDGLPREALPTEALADPLVWAALLPQTPPHALLRNLGVATANGTIATGSPAASAVAARLLDRDAMKRARVHPFAVLLATLIYREGHGIRGSKTWTPVAEILSALEDAYDAAFDAVVPTGKRILIGVDISGSMSASCIGTPIPASTAAAAMAVTLARIEPGATVVQFDTAVQRIVPITRRTGIAGLEATNGGGTDVGAPVRWALGESAVLRRGFGRTFTPVVQMDASRQDFDAFVILTDNETWAGRAHASELLARYRREVNPKAKLICCAMAASHASVVDPQDPLSLGCCGLDASLPAIVSDFIGR